MSVARRRDGAGITGEGSACLRIRAFRRRLWNGDGLSEAGGIMSAAAMTVANAAAGHFMAIKACAESGLRQNG